MNIISYKDSLLRTLTLMSFAIPHSFIHSLIQQFLIGYLLHAKHWEQCGELYYKTIALIKLVLWCGKHTTGKQYNFRI